MKSRHRSISSSSSDQDLVQLTGQLLVAHPQNPTDMLESSVILIVSVEDGVSVGIQLESVYPELLLDDICQRMDIPYMGNTPVYRSGNRGIGRISVIHTPDWRGPSTQVINSQISISNDISILAALSAGEGPSRFRACAGHWIWPMSQVTQQIAGGLDSYRWITQFASAQLVFDLDGVSQWRACLAQAVREQQDSWYQRLQLD